MSNSILGVIWGQGHIAEHLNINGKAGIIVPEGIIFQNANAYKDLRKNLIENWGLYAVISLPSGVFQPYSGVKTSILLLDKQFAKKTDKILFIKITNDGFDLGAKRQKIDKNDLPKALNIIEDWQQNLTIKADEKLGFVVEKSTIAKNGDYNLTADRYRLTTDYSNAKWPMVELGELEKQEKIEFLRGQGISKKDISEDGKNKCIHYGEIYTIYQPIIKDVISRTNFEGKILSKKGDVLIPATTTADAMGIAVARSINEDDVALGGDINIVRTSNKYILSDYLALLISNPPLKIELSTYAKGVNILHLSNSDVRNLKIPLPPLEIQEKIVEEIESYQKVIDGAKQVVENWKPNFKIDPKWPMVELGEVCKFTQGIQIPQSEQIRNFKQGYKRYIYISDLLHDEKLIFVKDKYPNKEVSKNDLIMVNTGNTSGKVFWGKSGILSNNVFKISFKENINSKYLFFNLSSDSFFRKLRAYFKQGAQPHLGHKIIAEQKIPLPPLEIQEKIVGEIEEEQKIVNANKDLITKMQKKIEAKISEVWN